MEAAAASWGSGADLLFPFPSSHVGCALDLADFRPEPGREASIAGPRRPLFPQLPQEERFIDFGFFGLRLRLPSPHSCLCTHLPDVKQHGAEPDQSRRLSYRSHLSFRTETAAEFATSQSPCLRLSSCQGGRVRAI